MMRLVVMPPKPSPMQRGVLACLQERKLPELLELARAVLAEWDDPQRTRRPHRATVTSGIQVRSDRKSVGPSRVRSALIVAVAGLREAQ